MTALLSRLRARTWLILLAIGALVAAGLRIFFAGKAAGRAAEGQERTAADVDRIRDAAARGDDAGVERELEDAFTAARRKRERRRGQ